MTSQGKKQSWFIDLKKTGTVGLGPAPQKADLIVAVGDADFVDIATGTWTLVVDFLIFSTYFQGSKMLRKPS